MTRVPRVISSDSTLRPFDSTIIAETAGGAITLTLPDASTIPPDAGPIAIRKVGSPYLTVAGVIDGVTNPVIQDTGTGAWIQAINGQWRIVAPIFA